MDMMERLHQRLKEVTDPGTNMDVMSMGLIRNLSINGGGAVSMEFRPSSPECPLVLPLAFRIREALERLEGVSGVTVTVVGHRMADMITSMINEKDDQT
jgi:ATP-binding protein involved in chromosome partitioning